MNVKVYWGEKRRGEYLLTEDLARVPQDVLASFGKLTLRYGTVDPTHPKTIGANPKEAQQALEQTGYSITRPEVTTKEV
jgi:uncharacterized protein YcgL (UPF0745 family)